ncbi:PREDICTED: putative uncharacterized protein encoded by LINC01552 [Condylura cristata]|uniref:putative uncharacterized protein encoded by LINC01552 n=1 Tax=Condylura cristata TaxID=143302 RepID=UPI000643C471|nr:PREDICTED: putative uncharacterized protein encoded by LINC01552 [Condylura cristata]
MFTRHTLYRQFAMLAETSFNYAKTKPLVVQSKTNLTDTTSSGSEHNPSMIDHKYMDIINEQLHFPPLAKLKMAAKHSLKSSIPTTDKESIH